MIVILLIVFIICCLIYFLNSHYEYYIDKSLKFSNTQILNNKYKDISKFADLKICKSLMRDYPKVNIIKNELNELVKYKKLRYKNNENIIKESKMSNIDILNLMINDKIDKDVLNSIKKYYNDIVNPIIYWLKIHYDRVRPYYLEKSLKNNVISIPSHPAYPSGHASTSYFFAYCINDITNDSSVFDLAKGIAHRREIGGMHYSSDSEYGKYIAKELYSKWKSKNKKLLLKG